jgi:hypothetical protein
MIEGKKEKKHLTIEKPAILQLLVWGSLFPRFTR